MYGEETAGRQYVKKNTQREPEYDKNTDRHRQKSTQVKWGGRDGRQEPDSGLGYTQDWNPQRWRLIEIVKQKADKRVRGYLR